MFGNDAHQLLNHLHAAGSGALPSEQHGQAGEAQESGAGGGQPQQQPAQVHPPQVAALQQPGECEHQHPAPGQGAPAGEGAGAGGQLAPLLRCPRPRLPVAELQPEEEHVHVQPQPHPGHSAGQVRCRSMGSNGIQL